MTAMATDAMRAMLDEMMGPERNVNLEERTGKTRHFTDDNVDKFYVAGCSPYYLFRGQPKNEGYLEEVDKYAKMLCDDVLRDQFAALPQEEKDKYGYEWDLYNLLEDLVKKCDVRIKKAQEKLGDESTKIQDKINERTAGWQARIDKLMKESEEAGEAGEVDKCQDLIKEAEALKAEMANDIKIFTREQSRFQGSQKVCLISGAVIAVEAKEDDGNLQNNAHFTGRNYNGWKAIREKLDDFKSRVGGVKPPPSKRAGPPPAGGAIGRSSDRDRDRDRDRGRDRDRDRVCHQVALMRHAHAYIPCPFMERTTLPCCENSTTYAL